MSGEETWLEFQRGSIAYIQSKFRTSPNDEPPTGEWYDNGAVATPSIAEFGIGHVRNSQNAAIISNVTYVYEREKTVAYTNAGTFVTYRETIYPSQILDAYSDTNAYVPNPPDTISGNKYAIGTSPGAYRTFPLGGVSVYYTPAATLNFGVSYGDGGGTVGISVTLMLQRRYSQNAAIHAKVLNSQSGKILFGFDGGTNWGSVYFKWGNH